MEAVMSLLFTDEEFQLAWKELNEPQLDGGWELFTEAMGVKIYRLFDQVPQRQLEASDWLSSEREKKKSCFHFDKYTNIYTNIFSVTAKSCDCDSN